MNKRALINATKDMLSIIEAYEGTVNGVLPKLTEVEGTRLILAYTKVTQESEGQAYRLPLHELEELYNIVKNHALGGGKN